MFLPLVDQMVASRGYSIVRTRGSTFSRYMGIFHRFYWNERTKGVSNGWDLGQF